MADQIIVGISPAGVEWVVYRRPGESDAEMEGRAALQRQRLALFTAKAVAAVPAVEAPLASIVERDPMAIVRVRDLTAIQVDRICDEAEFVETDADPAAFRSGATYVEGTARHLAAALDRLAHRDVADTADMWNAKTEAQEAMVLRSARVSQASACAKLADALGMTTMANAFRSTIRRVQKMGVWRTLDA